MAGELLRMGSALYRLGQDFRDNYGDGILVFRIEEIDSNSYCEELAGEASFTSVWGPHTVNFRDGVLLFDWYEERRTPIAGVRRLLNLTYRSMSRESAVPRLIARAALRPSTSGKSLGGSP